MSEIQQWETLMRPNHTFKHLIDEGFRPFRKDTVVWAKQMNEPFEVLTPHGPARGEVGDYWCVGPRNQQWLSHTAVFERTYTPVWWVAGSTPHPLERRCAAISVDGGPADRAYPSQVAGVDH